MRRTASPISTASGRRSTRRTGISRRTPPRPARCSTLGAAGAVPAGLGRRRGRAVPYRPEALAKKKENCCQPAEARSRDQVLSARRAARHLHAVPFQIIQSQKHIMLVHEYAGAVARSIWTNHMEAPADSWMGWSNGRWEGDTLVVDTTGFNDLTLVRPRRQFPQRCAARGRTLHAEPRHLIYEVTIEDPKVFTRPWKMSMPLYRRVESQRADPGIPMCGVRRGSDVRPPSEATGQVA